MHSLSSEKMRLFHECGIGQEQEHSGPARIFSGEESFGQPETGPLGSILDPQWPHPPQKDRLLNALESERWRNRSESSLCPHSRPLCRVQRRSALRPRVEQQERPLITDRHCRLRLRWSAVPG
jgi:hypothetical protein